MFIRQLRGLIVLGLMCLNVFCSGGSESESEYEIVEFLPSPIGPSEVSSLLFDNIFRVIDQKLVESYADMLAPEFVFVDDTQSEGLRWSKQEEVSLLSGVFELYRGVSLKVDPISRLRGEEGCEMVCGLFSIELIPDRADTQTQVHEEACLTACSSTHDGLWRLTEWRVVEQQHPEQCESDMKCRAWSSVKLNPG